MATKTETNKNSLEKFLGNYAKGVIDTEVSLEYQPRKPLGYWRNLENIAYEVKKIVDEIGHFPSRSELTERGLSSLQMAMQKYHGGVREVRKILGYEEPKEKPAGYWRDISNVKKELSKLIKKLRHFPTQEELGQYGYKTLAATCARNFGSIDELRKLMGYERKEKPRNYWKKWNNVKEEMRKLELELGHVPSTSEIRKYNSELIDAFKRHHGGVVAASKKLGAEFKKEKNGYWQKWENVERELQGVIEDLGHFPFMSELRSIKKSSLSAAISHYHGGINAVRQKMGYDIEKMDRGYWQDWNSFRKELIQIINKIGHFPTQKEIQRIKPMVGAAANNFGGLNKVCERLGYQPSIKLQGYWQDWKNVEDAIKKVTERVGHFPTQKDLKKYGERGVLNAISRWYGGLNSVRERVVNSEKQLEGLLEQYAGGKSNGK